MLAPDTVDKMIEWEDGELEDGGKEEVKLFQELINSGLAWQLQGMYGRHAIRLVDAGLCNKT